MNPRTKNRITRPWTHEEEDDLRLLYPIVPRRDVAKQLNRTVKAITAKAKNLDVRKYKIRFWTKADDEAIRSNRNMTCEELGELVGHNPNTVSQKAKALGLPAFVRKGYPPHKHGYTWVRWRGPDGKARRRERHRVVMEEILGRPLTLRERVHHIDGDKKNDRPDNLWLCDSVATHRRIHMSLEALMPELLAAGLIRFDREKGLYVVV